MRSAVCGILALAVAASYTCAAGAAEGTALAGDVNGDRVVSVLDMACLYTLLTNGWYGGSIENEDTVSQLTDVNGDDAIDVYDLQRLYEAVNGMRPFA